MNKSTSLILLGIAGVTAYYLVNSASAEKDAINLGGGGSSGDDASKTPDTTYVFNVTPPQIPPNSSSGATPNTSLNPISYSLDMAKQLTSAGVQNGSFYNASTGGYQNFVNGQGYSSKDPLPPATTKKASATTTPTPNTNAFIQGATTAYGVSTIKPSYDAKTKTGVDANGNGYSSATDLSKKNQKTTASNPFNTKVF